MASALPTHGDAAPALADALAHAHAPQAQLPLPEDAAHADVLRALAHDDLPTARRLAQALRGRSWRDAPDRQALDNAARRVIGAVIAAATSDAAPLDVFDPIAAPALAALHASDADLHDAGGAP